MLNGDKVKQIIYDAHLYKNRLESLIKTSIWAISWMGGILTILESCEGAASAYFLFSLSLLMEFVDQIKLKKEKTACLLHALFCLLSAILLILSFGILISVKIPITILFIISIVLTAYICVDCVLLWIIPMVSPFDNTREPNDNSANKNDIECFNKTLTEGALGNIE